MKVGDLVRHRDSGHCGIILCDKAHGDPRLAEVAVPWGKIVWRCRRLEVLSASR